MRKIVSIRLDESISDCLSSLAKQNHTTRSSYIQLILTDYLDDKTKLRKVERRARLLYFQHLKKYKAHQLYFKPNLRKKILTHILNNGQMVDIDSIRYIITLDLETLEHYEPDAKAIILKDLGDLKRWYDSDYWELELSKLINSKTKFIRDRLTK